MSSDSGIRKCEPIVEVMDPTEDRSTYGEPFVVMMPTSQLLSSYESSNAAGGLIPYFTNLIAAAIAKRCVKSAMCEKEQPGAADEMQTVASGATVIQTEPNLMSWDGPNDQNNPRNWSFSQKWTHIGILSWSTLLLPLGSTMFAPSVPAVMEDLRNNNPALATFVVSVFTLGSATGPLVVAPLSELYGRLHIYNISNVLTTIFTVASAVATDMNMLITFRFFAGCAGAAAVTNGGGTIADLMEPDQRGRAMSIWLIGALIGPMIGPVAGGFVAQTIGWRWNFWILSIAVGATTIVFFLVMRETYAPVLLKRKTKLQEKTYDGTAAPTLEMDHNQTQSWKHTVLRPMKLLFLSPICTVMSAYLGLLYGIMNLLLSTFTFVFQNDYHFSESLSGCVYVSVGVGTLIGLAHLGWQSDPIAKRLARKAGTNDIKPEYRLPILIFAGPLIPAGLLVYGWSAQYTVFWVWPLLGFLLIGIGLVCAFTCITSYLVDAFDRVAASAVAAATILRSISGACFPLFALQMYSALGLGWANTMLAFFAFAMCPVPLLLFRYGERIRNHQYSHVNLE